MRRLPVVGALALVLALAGCVASPTPEPTSTAGPSSPTVAPTPTPTPTAPAFEAVDPSLFFVDQMPDPPWGSWGSQDVNFAAPEGGIGCSILGEVHGYLWGCAIDDTKTWEFPRDDPADYCYDAQVPCGWGIEVTGAELPHPRYRGDPGFPGAFATYDSNHPIHVLELGQSVTFGDVTCYSEETGIRCENAASGHGFVISHTRNDIY